METKLIIIDLIEIKTRVESPCSQMEEGVQ
jgi:hypothetical protein